MTTSHQNPEHEIQIRPLFGLTPEQAGGRKITARLAKSVVTALQLSGEKPRAVPQTRQSKTKQRRLIDAAIGELLVLLSQKASYDILTAKVEPLHRQIQNLFLQPKSGVTQTLHLLEQKSTERTKMVLLS
jgi:hypothetical protein